MSIDKLFEYEEELRAGGAPNAEVFTKALRGVLKELKQERSGMEASATELKGSIDKLDSRVSALDHKVDAVELRLNARIDLVKAEVITEIRNSSLEIMKAMNNQLYKTLGTIGTIIAVFYLIEKFV